MAHLLKEATFCDRGKDGLEIRTVFPVGTPITEARLTAEWADEYKRCESICFEQGRKGDTSFEVWIVGGRPRALRGEYFNKEWKPNAKNSDGRRDSRDRGPGFNQYPLSRDRFGGESTRGSLPEPVPRMGIETQAGRGDVPNRSDDVQRMPRKISAATPVRTGTGSGRGTNDPIRRESVEAFDDSGTTIGSGEPGSVPGGLTTAKELPANLGIVVVVDFMNLLVRAFFAGKPTKTHAVKSFLSTCANIVERLSPEYLIFAMDGGHTVRSSMFPDYKAHREAKPMELVYQIELATKALDVIGWPMIRFLGWEADDVVSSTVNALAGRSSGLMVASSDKDLTQLIGKASIYHPWDGGSYVSAAKIQEKYGVKPSQMADFLSLVGDASDGIPGVTGIGPKKAAELINQFGDLASILEAAKTSRVAGSAGNKLIEQRSTAELSRKLVELRSDLAIPLDWLDFETLDPRAGWVEELRRLDLASNVDRLTDVLNCVGRVKTGSSLIEVPYVEIPIESPEIASRGQVLEFRSVDDREGNGIDLRVVPLPSTVPDSGCSNEMDGSGLSVRRDGVFDIVVGSDPDGLNLLPVPKINADSDCREILYSLYVLQWNRFRKAESEKTPVVIDWEKNPMTEATFVTRLAFDSKPFSLPESVTQRTLRVSAEIDRGVSESVSTKQKSLF